MSRSVPHAHVGAGRQVVEIGPVRTCVGCRDRACKSDLLRVVADRGAAVAGRPVPLRLDDGVGLPGRGAHLHPRSECLELALRRKAFARALKLSAAVDASALVAYLREGLDSSPSTSADVRVEPRQTVPPARAARAANNKEAGRVDS